MGSSRIFPIVLVFVLGSLWGLHFSLIKICSESELPYFSILTASTLGVALAFVAVTLIQRRLPKVSLAHVRFYLICALLGYVGPIMIELVVAKSMEAGLLTLIVSTTPLVTLAIAAALKTETVTPRGFGGVCLGCVAIFMLIAPQLNSFQFNTPNASAWPYLLATFAIPLSYGVYHNYVSKAWPVDSSTWQVACGEMLVALLMLLPLYIFFNADFNANPGFPHDLFPQHRWQSVHWAILIMVVFAVLEVFLYFEIIRLAGAVSVSLSNFVTIAAGVVWGMIIFSERPGWWQWQCVALLMVALYLVLGNRKFQQRQSLGINN